MLKSFMDYVCVVSRQKNVYYIIKLLLVNDYGIS